MRTFLFTLDDPGLSNVQEGDIIRFEMPPFCSGEYTAVVRKDDKHGLYIDKSDDFFDGCRDYEVYSAEEGKKYL